MYRKHIRFINTFRDLDLLEQVYSCCEECGHIGMPLDPSSVPGSKSEDTIFSEIRENLYCGKCRSNQISIRLDSNEYMRFINYPYIFSDYICRMYRIKPDNCALPFRGTVN